MRRTEADQLWRRASRGDLAAFAALYRAHERDVVRYCRSLLHDEQDALDAAQSTWTALWAADLADRDVPLRPWLFRVAHNEAVTLLRRRRPHEALAGVELPALDDVATSVELRERLAHLHSDLRTLPERQRAALLLREVAGLEHAEIAAVFAISPQAAKQTIYEARRGLVEADRGRRTACGDVERAISDGDGRVRRGRWLRAHLRHCPACRGFATAVGRQRQELQLLFPATAGLGALAAAGGGAVVGGSALASGGGVAAGAGAGGGGLLALGGSTAAKVAVAAAIATGAVAAPPAVRDVVGSGGGQATAAAAVRTTPAARPVASPFRDATTAPPRAPATPAHDAKDPVPPDRRTDAVHATPPGHTDEPAASSPAHAKHPASSPPPDHAAATPPGHAKQDASTSSPGQAKRTTSASPPADPTRPASASPPGDGDGAVQVATPPGHTDDSAASSPGHAKQAAAAAPSAPAADAPGQAKKTAAARP